MKIQMFNKVGLREWEGKVFIIQPLSILRKPGAARDGEFSALTPSTNADDHNHPFLAARMKRQLWVKEQEFLSLTRITLLSKWFADLKTARRQNELVSNIYHPQQSGNWFKWYGWLEGHPYKYYPSLLELCENREVYSHKRMMNDLLVKDQLSCIFHQKILSKGARIIL